MNSKTYNTLKDAAIAAAHAADSAKKLKSIKDQKVFVKKLVGPYYDECSYDAHNDTWTIGGRDFKCFTYPNYYTGSAKLPAMGVWNGSSCYYLFYTFAELGDNLKEHKA